jgi:hypothetical protein
LIETLARQNQHCERLAHDIDDFHVTAIGKSSRTINCRRAMVDGVAATSRSAAFERIKLSDEAQSSMAFGIVAIFWARRCDDFAINSRCRRFASAMLVIRVTPEPVFKLLSL